MMKMKNAYGRFPFSCKELDWTLPLTFKKIANSRILDLISFLTFVIPSLWKGIALLWGSQ